MEVEALAAAAAAVRLPDVASLAGVEGGEHLALRAVPRGERVGPADRQIAAVARYDYRSCEKRSSQLPVASPGCIPAMASITSATSSHVLNGMES